MSDQLERLLLSASVPDEVDAQRRAWAVVRAAHAEREPVRRPGGRMLRPALALGALAVVLAAAVSPVGGWVGDRIRGAEDAEPGLFHLPVAGRLLVVSERGPWIVREDGSKRLLGSFEDASFSPNGRFVVVTRGRRVTAVEPDGDPRWSLTRPEAVTDARWAPSGFRIAYRAGPSLRVVAGDGTGDRLLADDVAPLAPVWRPDPARNVLAYADTRGRVNVVDVDSGEELSRSRPGTTIAKLLWAPGWTEPFAARGAGVLDVAFRADGALRASTLHDVESGRTSVLVSTCSPGGPCREARRVFAGAGRLTELAWSPDGRWLLVSWPDADQLLFLRLPGVRDVAAVSDIRREFDPGGAGRTSSPRVAGWIAAPDSD